MATKTFPYSRFLRGPGDVLPALEEGDVVLQRRDDSDLVLSSEDRFQARLVGLNVAARVLRDLAREDRPLAERLLSQELAWLRWLPDGDRAACLEELMDNLAAGSETGNLLPFARALLEWQATAEVWSDPGTARRLRRPFTGDGQTIERPNPPSRVS